MADGHYQVLARKWRPQTFDDVVGQEHITRTLRNAIASGRIPHAFLFIGSRGIGKTTSARILAKALNCASVDAPTPDPCGTCGNCTSISDGTNIDVIEIDGASNNSVDDVRQIRENIRMVPSSSRYKIYVIDEVHQLSTAAFNALLKTLEEPPPHGIFVLATTESHKIPATIISRCQRYDFRRVGIAGIVALLRKILDAEGVACSDEALHAIARAADGGVRDSESILDQLMSYCDKEITFEDVFDVLGLVDWRVLNDLCNGILERDVTRLLTIVEDVVVNGKDLGQFVQEILRFFRNLLICKSGAPAELLNLPEEEVVELRQKAEQFTLTEVIRLVEQFSELTRGYDSQLAQRTSLEALLIRMSQRSVDVSVDSVLEKIAQLRDGGGPPAAGGGAAGTSDLSAPAASSGDQSSLLRSADPPVPTPEPTAPTTSAPIAAAPNRIEATSDRIAGVWMKVIKIAGVDSMNLATWMPHAVPVAIEGDTLVLEFESDQETGRAIIEKPANAKLIRDALQQVTSNVQRFRTQSVARAVVTEEAAPAETDNRIAPQVNPEAGMAALENPLISKVVDVFKGQIIDINDSPEPV